MSANVCVDSDPWMAWIDFDNEGSTIYDPANGITDSEPDLSWWRESGRARVLVIRRERRPNMWLDDDGELEMWDSPGSSYSIETQAFETDEMDVLGFDSDADVLLTWQRACMFVDALNTAEDTP